MPYKNIVFAKLEKRLFNDPRWYMMSEASQLNYIRFILFASETYNKIPKNLEAIKKAFKTDQDLKTIEATIKEIKTNFPKFKENKHFYYFNGFEEKTNYIPHREIRRKSQVLPKDGVDKEEDKDKDIDIDKDIDKDIIQQPSAVLKAILDQCNQYINIYSLINKVKKKYRARKSLELYIPDEVLIKVGKSYLKNQEKVKEAWPWFCKAIEMAWAEYHAEQAQKSNTGKRDNFAPAIKEILGVK